MPKTVRILGSAPNLMEMPPLPEGVEMWMANNPKVIRKYVQEPLLSQWTRWFNLHSRIHMETTYPLGFNWYRQFDGTKPFYTQKIWGDIPGCTVFPHKDIQAYFPEAKRYYVCSITWMTALAIMEGFTRIEYYGIVLRDKKRDHAAETDYTFERRNFFYWINVARKRGIEITYPPEIDMHPLMEAGDPATYTGPLYGYETKPELSEVKCDCPVEWWWEKARYGTHLTDCPSYIKGLGDSPEYQLKLPMPIRKPQ